MYNYIVTAEVKSTSVKLAPPLYAIDFKLAPIFCNQLQQLKTPISRCFNTPSHHFLKNSISIAKLNFKIWISTLLAFMLVKTKCSILYTYFNRFQNVGIHIMVFKQFKTSFLSNDMLIVLSTTYLIWTIYFITTNFQDFELTE